MLSNRCRISGRSVWPTCRRLLAAATGCAALLTATPSSLVALEGDELSDDAQSQVDELQSMLTSRGIGRDMFQFEFRPLEFDRILLRSPTGDETVYHYLTFYLRNQTANEASFVYEHANRYNEVLQAVVSEFERSGRRGEPGWRPGVSTDGSGGLRVDTEAINDAQVARVLQRDQLQPETRVARLTAWIEDEDGSRFRAWNPFPGMGRDIELDDVYAFDDRGQLRQGTVFNDVREAIEEHAGRRLYTVHELRDLQLPPYDATQPGIEDGLYAAGEIYGVIIFDRLPVTGDTFSLRINGLSSYTRRNEPEHDRDELADYYNTRLQRRAYQIRLHRPGDEHHLGEQPIEMTAHGWAWVPAFMRLRLRRDTAYATYLLDNIRLEREGNGPMLDYTTGAPRQEKARSGPRMHDRKIAEIAEPFIAEAIAQEWPEILRLKALGLDSDEALISEAYAALVEERGTEAERAELRDRLARRLADIGTRRESIAEITAAVAEYLAPMNELMRDQSAVEAAE